MDYIKDQNKQVFLELLRAGLWENKVQLTQYDKINFAEIYRIAEEQAVVGLVAAGLEHVEVHELNEETRCKPTQGELLIFAGSVIQIEQQNKAMNEFVALLIEKLRKANIYTLLVKGQGIAQCYERPLWRTCGDVDLLLDSENYDRAKTFLQPLAESVEPESEMTKHFGLTIQSWSVELHGTLRSFILSRMDKVVDKVQADTFENKRIRKWTNGSTEVLLPFCNNDVIFVFTHILQHYFIEGVGLRQVCDWCRLLWTYHETIDRKILEQQIREMGIMTEWKTFAALAIDTLGMPVEAMPLYTPSTKWSKKAEKVLAVIWETGNFGHNRIVEVQTSVVKRKLNTLLRLTHDTIKQLSIFPMDAMRVWFNMLIYRIRLLMTI